MLPVTQEFQREPSRENHVALTLITWISWCPHPLVVSDLCQARFIQKQYLEYWASQLDFHLGSSRCEWCCTWRWKQHRLHSSTMLCLGCSMGFHHSGYLHMQHLGWKEWCFANHRKYSPYAGCTELGDLLSHVQEHFSYSEEINQNWRDKERRAVQMVLVAASTLFRA